ncbi:histidine kinase dimerization/phospho-acceptor domain-containing protein [Marinibaculum pumilum]|uniref:histidine kinase n=1 Tax=Marinibaculum pumilum TaxID=1766165 RepID=A0ABV7KV88_9PROT
MRKIFNLSPAPVLGFAADRDRDGRIVDFRCTLANPAARRLRQWSGGTPLGTRLSEELTVAVTGGLLDSWARVVLTGRPAHSEQMLYLNQKERWFEVSAARLDDGVLVNMTDITGQKVAEEKVRFAERRLHRILNSALDGIITLDSRKRISSFNASAEQLFGYRAAEMIGQSLDDLLPQALRARHTALVNAFAEGPDRSLRMSEWRLVRGLHRDGHLIPLLASISKISVDGVPTLTVFMRDMSSTLRHEDELRATIGELQDQRRRAEQSSFAKSEFLAKMSHELRTPLNAILGFSEMIRDGLLGEIQPPAYRDYIDDIHAGGQHLLSVIDDILDLSRIESEKVVLHFEALDMAAEIADSLRMVEMERERRGQRIAVDLAPEARHVTADRRVVRQILLNLLANVVRYVQPGGEAQIVARLDPPEGPAPQLTLTVADNGPGLPGAVLDNLGQPFIAAGSIYADTNTGTGLGLAIVKGLAEAHSGMLQIRSSATGTAVTVRLPCSNVPPSG